MESDEEFDKWLNIQLSDPNINKNYFQIRKRENNFVDLFHDDNQLMGYMRHIDVINLYKTLKQWVDSNGMV